jgi:hypothetical protein
MAAGLAAQARAAAGPGEFVGGVPAQARASAPPLRKIFIVTMKILYRTLISPVP